MPKYFACPSAMNSSGFAAEETALLESIVEEVDYAEGETIIAKRSPDDLFLLLRHGQCLPSTHRW